MVIYNSAIQETYREKDKSTCFKFRSEARREEEPFQQGKAKRLLLMKITLPALTACVYEAGKDVAFENSRVTGRTSEKNSADRREFSPSERSVDS